MPTVNNAPGIIIAIKVASWAGYVERMNDSYKTKRVMKKKHKEEGELGDPKYPG